MCGICAVFGIAPDADHEKLRNLVLKQSKLLRHRGPDWNGIQCYKNCIVAHERLAIVGLHSGAQPIVSRNNGICLSVNGEIYNYKELEKSLDDKSGFVTDSDCEVLLHLYERDGPDFLEKNFVNGMYAFVLYDEIKDILVVGRDPIGIMPLYMGWNGNGSLWFASELKAMQEHCDHLELFPPGNYYVASGSTIEGTFKQFYNSQWFIDENYIPTSSLIKSEFRSALSSSVRRHLLSEVPFGLLLSGGLDSSLIASIATREYKKLGNNDVLRSFCIGLAGSPDIAAAEKVAEFIGTRHYSFTFTVQQGMDAISDVIYHLETFDVTTVRASTPMFLLARRLKATGCKMVLSGEGADEVFGGYLYFHKAPSREEFHKETVRKIKSLHQYDCLRANKAMSSWGVETRVPFLDREFLEYAMNLDPAVKMCGKGKIEKELIRSSFDTPEDPYLPREVLWRQKEQFSDGVGYNWIDSLKAVAESKVTDLQMKLAPNRFTPNPPTSKEEYYYREIFNRHFPTPSSAATVPYTGGKSVACSTAAAIAWDKAFQGSADPSGRAIAGVHNEAYI